MPTTYNGVHFAAYGVKAENWPLAAAGALPPHDLRPCRGGAPTEADALGLLRPT